MLIFEQIVEYLSMFEKLLLRPPFSTHLYITPPLTLTLTQQTLTISISISISHTPNPQFTMVAPYAAAEAALLMQPPLPYHPNRDPEPRHPLPFFCQGLKGFILSALLVAALIFVVWNFSHPALRLASASLSAVSGECNISLALTNPNRRLTASYDRMEISLLYDHAKISRFHHPRIVQPERSQIALEANLAFSGLDLGDDVATAMKQELDRGGLELAIEVFAELKFWNVDQKSGSTPYIMRAYCGGMMFNFTSSDMPATFFNPYQECKVYVYSK